MRAAAVLSLSLSVSLGLVRLVRLVTGSSGEIQPSATSSCCLAAATVVSSIAGGGAPLSAHCARCGPSDTYVVGLRSGERASIARMPANEVHPVATTGTTSGVKQQQELLTVEEIEEDAGHVVLEPSPGGLNLRAKQIARGTRSAFGECEESWISADAAARATATEHDPYLLFGGDSSVARALLKAAFLGDSRSGRYVQLVWTALYGGVLYPMVMHAIGFHFLSCVAVALLKGVNALCKVTGLRFQTFTDHGSADNPTVHVWRCAPASVREANIVAVRRELTFGARIPGGGPHGEVAGLLMLLPLIIYSWPLMSNRAAGMTIVLGVLSFNIQLCVPCTLSILFMQSCETLAQSIDSVGIWQHQIGRGVPRQEVDARNVDGGFKQAYTSFVSTFTS